MNLPSANLASTSAMLTESPLRDLEAIIRSRTSAHRDGKQRGTANRPHGAADREEIPAQGVSLDGHGRFAGVRPERPTTPISQQVAGDFELHQKFVEQLRVRAAGFSSLFGDAVHVRYLKDIALTYPKHYSTVVLVGFALKIPEELQPFTARFRLPLPTHDELRAIVFDAAGEWGAEHGRRDVQTTNKAIDLLVRNLVGLTATDARAARVQSHQGRWRDFRIGNARSHAREI